MADQFSEYAEKYLERLRQVIDGINHIETERFVDLLLKSRESGKTVFFVGNGGSAATSSHFANDLSIGTRQQEKPFKVFSLVDNVATLSAIGNDYGYENVFAREIQAIATPADVLIAITTSGNSGNILKALQAAKENNVPTVVLTGAGMGQLPKDVQSLHIPSLDTARIQECHILIGHIICGLVEADIFSELRS